MTFLQNILRILDTDMVTPTAYGWFHLMWCAIALGAGILLLVFLPKPSEKQTRTLLLTVSLTVLILEVYKQINYTFTPTDTGITADFQWYAFPFQFCSQPMYVGLLAVLLPKGKIRECLLAFLGTYALFAGLCVMVSPGDVFIDTVGINIQTMVCHGSMVSVGMWLLGTNTVPTKHKTILKALPVFGTSVGIAALLNEIAHITGITENETFNMFFISPHEDPSLIVYSSVQEAVPFPFCLILYIAGFTLASYIVLLLGMGIQWILRNAKTKKT